MSSRIRVRLERTPDHFADARAAATRREPTPLPSWKKPRSRFGWALVAGAVAVCAGLVVAGVEVWLVRYVELRSIGILMVAVGGAFLWLVDSLGLMKDPYSEAHPVLGLREQADTEAAGKAE